MWDWIDKLKRDDVQPLLESDLEVLASLGLLERVDIHREAKKGDVDFISIHYYRMTYLADDLLNAGRF